MWIRSQDKMELVNVVDKVHIESLSHWNWKKKHSRVLGEDDMEYIKESEEYVIISERINLGVYSSKEKAIKVLDKIAELFYDSKLSQRRAVAQTGVYDDGILFNMPSDEKV